MQADGYSLDDKREKTEENDIPDIVTKWKNRKEQKENNRKSKFFYVEKKEIEGNDFDLSINRYKVTDYKEIEYEDSKVILEKIEILEKEILDGISILKSN